jgi:outer membrane receptor protein involved in Fe transport
MNRSRKTFARLMCSAAFVALGAFAGVAHAADEGLDIAPQPLAMALKEFGMKTGQPVLYGPALADRKMSSAVVHAPDAETALVAMLDGTGLTYRRNGDTFLIVSASDPQSGSAAGDGADQGTVAALIVTAQKKEEAIQDVPIAISAFTEKSLEEQKIEGGFDLLKAIPNVTFSKNNFTSYNFSIRGIGTKAVSATTDPGVAVSFNNIALLQNRLFEQEYFDVERVEVLRGPQGTLYGRNATAGVINVISAKPNLREFAGWIKGEVGNYHAKRASAMVNIPLVEDKLAVRFAGSFTDRQGYDFNTGTKHAVNGRDLWSGRITVAFNPTDRIRSNLVWERFNEDDNRSRTGKQLCHRDPGLQKVGNTSTVTYPDRAYSALLSPALYSQGCLPGSLYEDSAFGTPNGLALPFVFGMLFVGSDCRPGCAGTNAFPIGRTEDGASLTLLNIADPYGGLMQSRDLRVINSFRDPVYRAKADVVELNVDFDLTDSLTFTSQTAYNKDQTYSFQDFNRFNTLPIFRNTSDLILNYWPPESGIPNDPSPWQYLAPGGKFCDPQLGCSDTLAGFDIAQAKGEQFSQEVRLQSSFDGPLNFSVGANYTRFKTLIDYYVFYNLISAFAQMSPFGSNPTTCALSLDGGYIPHDPPVPGADLVDASCPYIDPNPIESIDGEGHNYFRSKNPYKLKSAAAFGELYWQASDALKVTAGLRYTDDKKTFIPVPSQVLMARGIYAGGVVSRGYPEKPAIKQHWGEFTGRLGVDWKPDLSFTDQTMLYAFYSRGYKGGGANPPTPGYATAAETGAQYGWDAATVAFYEAMGGLPVLKITGAEYGPTFKPEFVNAFEVGSKNTLLGGALVLNTSAFFYDYKDYQVSQIRDRSAVNENFDAKVWGLELETLFSPTRNLRINANLGYLDTRIGDGATSIDIMNRTQGDSNYIVMKPWAQQTSNCIVPLPVVEQWLHTYQAQAMGGYMRFCGSGGILALFSQQPIDPNPDIGGGLLPYDVNNYPEINGGAGIRAQLGGNELPNSPHWTANIGAQYSVDVLDGWRATIRGDAYWQSQSWARVYNADPYDKLHGWYNANLSLWIENDDGLKIELYAKNILDDTPITDAFLNSDDTALTTNVFTLDPRLIGLSIKKDF